MPTILIEIFITFDIDNHKMILKKIILYVKNLIIMFFLTEQYRKIYNAIQGLLSLEIRKVL